MSLTKIISPSERRFGVALAGAVVSNERAKTVDGAKTAPLYTKEVGSCVGNG